MNNDINEIEFIRSNFDLIENYDQKYKKFCFNSNETSCETSKVWYRKLLKAVKLIEQDLNEKSLKMNSIRNNLNLLPSMSSKLIFKEVEENLILMKKNINYLYSFMIDMTKLDVKYEAIVYDCNRNNCEKRDIEVIQNSTIKPDSKICETSFAFEQRINSSPSSFFSSPFCNTIKSMSSFIKRDSKFNPTINKNKSLNTPNKYFKDIHGYASPISPKSNKSSPSVKATPRKNTIPKKRNLSHEIHPSTSDSSDPISLFDDALGEGLHVKGDAIVEELINYPVLHEKLAQSINRVFNGENFPNSEDKSEICNDSHLHQENHFHFNQYNNSDCSDNVDNIKSFDANNHLDRTLTEEGNNIEANEIQLPETAIQDILSGLENDPVFNDFLNICSNKRDIYTTNLSSPFTSSSLTTPKSDEAHFKSPSSTPIRSISSINCVVKDLMKDLKTPEKSEPMSSPLSTAIESTINDSSYNLSESSKIIPILDFNSLINSPSKKIQNGINNQPSYAPYTIPLPISLQSQDCTLIINNAIDTNMLGAVNKKQNQFVNKTAISNTLKKMPLKNKKVNLARIESSNFQSLKRKLSEKSEIVNQFRSIVPKSKDNLSTNVSAIVNKPSGQSSTSRTNLKAKFNDLIETTSNKKVESKNQNNDLVLLKSMNVDKFLSLIYEESAKS